MHGHSVGLKRWRGPMPTKHDGCQCGIACWECPVPGALTDCVQPNPPPLGRFRAYSLYGGGHARRGPGGRNVLPIADDNDDFRFGLELSRRHSIDPAVYENWSRRRKFACILKGLFEHLDVTQQAYSISNNLSQSDLSRWLNGKRIPKGSPFVDKLFDDFALKVGPDRALPEHKGRLRELHVRVLAENDALQGELQSLVYRLTDAMDQAADRKVEIEALSREIRVKNDEIRNLTVQRNQLASREGEIRRFSEKLEIGFDRLEQERSRLQQEVESLRRQLDSAERELAASVAECRRLERASKRAQDAIETRDAAFDARQPGASSSLHEGPFAPDDISINGTEGETSPQEHGGLRYSSALSPRRPLGDSGRLAGWSNPVVNPVLLRGPQPEISAWGLLLRPWQAADCAQVLEAYQDDKIRNWSPDSLNTSHHAAQWILEWKKRWKRNSGACWAVVSPSAPRTVLGMVALASLAPRLGLAELEYWVVPSAKRQDIGIRAIAALTKWSAELGVVRIEFVHSMHSREQCEEACEAGFQVEGVKRRLRQYNDGWHDMCLHSWIGDVEVAIRRRSWFRARR